MPEMPPKNVSPAARQTGSDQESKARLQAILETAFDFILVTDVDGTVQYINRSVAGVDIDQVIGAPMFDYVPPAFRDTVRDAMEKVLRTGETVQYETKAVGAHGKPAWYLSRMGPLIIDGEITALTICAIDVTQRKAAEEKRLRSERALRLIVEGTSGEVGEDFFRSLVRHLASALEVRYAMLGVLADPAESRVHTIAVWAGDGIAEDFQYDLAGTPCENVVKQRLCIYPRDVCRDFPQDRLLVEMNVESYIGTPLISAGGKVLGLLVVMDDKPMEQNPAASSIVQLFATRAASELERSRAEAALRESETRFRRYFELGMIGMAVTSLEKGWVEVNDRLCEMLGYSREELIERTWSELTHPDDLAADVAQFDRVLAGEIDGYWLDKRFICKDGRAIDTSISVKCMRRADGTADYLLALVQDVTQRKAAEAEREALIRDLEQKNTELEQFTYTVSHDLKSPLFTVKGFLGLLARDVARGDIDKLPSHVERISTAADRMNRLLEELLELSRIGRVVNPPARFSLSEAAREVVDQLAEPIARRGVQVEIAPDLPLVRADRTRLVQVLQNLVGNAVRFLGEQPDPKIEIGVRNDTGEAVCFVRDNGAGIDPKFQQRIFGLFDQLDPQLGGTGIGLAVVKRIVEVLGQRVWVESDGEGRGSTFCFTIGSLVQDERPKVEPDGA